MDKRERIKQAATKNRCPQCDKPLEDERFGTGALSDGTFCSMVCLATFHEDYYRMRADQPAGTRPPGCEIVN